MKPKIFIILLLSLISSTHSISTRKTLAKSIFKKTEKTIQERMLELAQNRLNEANSQLDQFNEQSRKTQKKATTNTKKALNAAENFDDLATAGEGTTVEGEKLSEDGNKKRVYEEVSWEIADRFVNYAHRAQKEVEFRENQLQDAIQNIKNADSKYIKDAEKVWLEVEKDKKKAEEKSK